jgi:hypothetical protein
VTVRILDTTDTLAEADSKGRLSIWYSDGTSAFFRTIVEISDDDDLLDELRNAGWTIEPAPAGVYQHPPMDDQSADEIPEKEYGCRIDSDGGRVEPLRLAKTGSA